MCGVVGVYNFSKKDPVEKEILKKMTDIITHRGPDGFGYYFDDENGLAFGHRRLSIIDLEGGIQPMVSKDKNFVITFNGEIYNYRELKKELEFKNVSLSTNSDTEVLLTSYQIYYKEVLNKLNGIFAFGIWNKQKRELFISRDHLGVKPLYYFYNESTFIFASEIKSILQHPQYKLAIEPEAIDYYLTFKSTPSPVTLFKNIFMLPPASYIIVNESGISAKSSYWDSASEINYSLNENEWLDLLAPATERALKLQMVSDVPISISLSGGIDSNMILSLVNSHLENPVHSFTIGFTDNEKDDEINFAKKAEQYFKTNVFTRILSANDYQDWFQSYMWHLEEPVGNEPALAYYSVAKLAHDYKIKVLLSGQGADELFAGYPRHIAERYQFLFPGFTKAFLKPAAAFTANEQIRRSLYCLSEKNELERFFLIYSIFFPEEKSKLYTEKYYKSIDINGGKKFLAPYFNRFTNHSSLDKMLHIDARFSLADNLLLAGDKMAMAASVETRVPFLDIDYVKLVESIPAKFKINNFKIKHIHKLNAKKYLPDEIINRRKIGFANPMEKWLVQQLGQEFERMVNDKDIVLNEYLNKNYILKLFNDHKNGKADYKRHLFLIYSLYSWYKTFFK